MKVFGQQGTVEGGEVQVEIFQQGNDGLGGGKGVGRPSLWMGINERTFSIKSLP